MQFSSLQAFLDMGGYGFYVWLSYGVATVLIVGLILFSKQKHHSVLNDINNRERRKGKLRQAAKNKAMHNETRKNETEQNEATQNQTIESHQDQSEVKP